MTSMKPFPSTIRPIEGLRFLVRETQDAKALARVLGSRFRQLAPFAPAQPKAQNLDSCGGFVPIEVFAAPKDFKGRGRKLGLETELVGTQSFIEKPPQSRAVHV